MRRKSLAVQSCLPPSCFPFFHPPHIHTQTHVCGCIGQEQCESSYKCCILLLSVEIWCFASMHMFWRACPSASRLRLCVCISNVFECILIILHRNTTDDGLWSSRHKPSLSSLNLSLSFSFSLHSFYPLCLIALLSPPLCNLHKPGIEREENGLIPSVGLHTVKEGLIIGLDR